MINQERRRATSTEEAEFETLARLLFKHGIEFKIHNRRIIEDPLKGKERR